MGYMDRLEIQAMSSADLDELLRSYGTTASKSGAVVTADSALRYSAVYACVRVVSEDVAKLPLILYRRLSDGGKERATDHHLYGIMHDRPNEWMTSFEFREMMQAHLELRGNAFAFKNVVRGELRELLPIHPDRVTVKQDTNWRVSYEVKKPSGVLDREYGPHEILHLRGMSLDSFSGLTPVSYHRETIGLGIAMREHGALLFANGAKPGGILEVPGKLKTEAQQRLKDSFYEQYGGENRFKTLVLEEGAKYHPITMTSADAQYIDEQKFNRSEIASIYRVPPHKIGDLDRSTNNNIEAQDRQYIQESLGGRLTRVEQRLNESLLTPEDRKTYFFAFLTEGLLAGLTKDRYEAYGSAIQSGWMNRNEVRVRENLNPEPGLDEFLRPLNMDGANKTVDTDEQED